LPAILFVGILIREGIVMTEQLEQAFAEASKLPPQEQDALAVWLLKELESDKRWEKSFVDSQDELAKLAAEALAEHQDGRTEELDPGQI